MKSKFGVVVVLLSIVLAGCGALKPSLPERAKSAIRDEMVNEAEYSTCILPDEWSVRSAQKVNNRYLKFGPITVYEEAWCVVINPPFQCEGFEEMEFSRHFFVSRSGEHWEARSFEDDSEGGRVTWFEENGCSNW